MAATSRWKSQEQSPRDSLPTLWFWPFWQYLTLNTHWKHWCWSRSSSTLATWLRRADSLEKTLRLGKIVHYFWCNGRGPHLEWSQEPQGSSPFRTPIAGSLQSWERWVRPRLVCRNGPPLASRVVHISQTNYIRCSRSAYRSCLKIQIPRFPECPCEGSSS